MTANDLLRLACIYAERDQQAFARAIANCSKYPGRAKDQKATAKFLKELRAYRIKRWGKTQIEKLVDEMLSVSVTEAKRRRE